MSNKRALQYFSDAYLKSLKEIEPEHILRFLEDFRLLCKERTFSAKQQDQQDQGI